MKSYYILLVVIAVIIAWLSFFVLPGKTVMSLEAIGENEVLHGPIYGVMSSSSNAGKPQTEIVHRDEWRRVVDARTGWGAVVAWRPFAFLIALTSVIFGFLVGWWCRGEDAKIEAHKNVGLKLETLITDLAQTKASLSVTKVNLKIAEDACRRAKPFVDDVEQRANAKIIKTAENKAAEEAARADKAEDGLRKVTAQLREIREKRRKSKEASPSLLSMPIATTSATTQVVLVPICDQRYD